MRWYGYELTIATAEGTVEQNKRNSEHSKQSKRWVLCGIIVSVSVSLSGNIMATQTESGTSGEGGPADTKLTLYSYWRSSCSFRVRIALNLKGLKYEYKAINLLNGEQSDPEFLKLNPIGFVPVLVDGDAVISDSFAIIMYLEDKYPQHPLLPHDIHKRSINFQAAHIVCSTIQPLQNLTILKYIEEKVSPNETLPWAKSVIEKGFTALEKLLIAHAGRYATGDEIFLADLFLAPQLYTAFTKFKVDKKEFPILAGLNEKYKEIPAFQEASPEKQPDAVP